LLQGSAGIGWQTLALDDIERIEILRGSNSATYGARAFLGVVNIVSRDVRETVGAAVSLTGGDNGVSDSGLRIGWEMGDASMRLSADRVGDDGLRGAFGKNYTERLNLSSHMSLERGAELELRAGGAGAYLGRGDPTDSAGNPGRRWFLGSQFMQLDWRQPLDDAQDLALSASHTENSNIDRSTFLTHTGSPDYYGAVLDASGKEYVDALTAQHTRRLSPSLRAVWGGELRQERVAAPTLFDSGSGYATDYYRLFGSAEWRMTDSLLLNAGALAERNTISGDSLSPRLMLNWRVAPGHTLRAGASTAFRPPSAYEKYGRVRYFDANGQNPTGYYVFNDGSLRAEKLISKELGYYFATSAATLSGDVRVFDEQIVDGISASPVDFDPVFQSGTTLNGLDYGMKGVELQLNWNPSPATRLLLSQAWTTIQVSNAPTVETRYRAEHGAPRYAASLALMHSFESGLHLSLMHQVSDDMALMSISDRKWLFSMARTDLRVAQDLRLGNNRAELALTVQNLAEPYQDGDWKFLFHHRALLSLKIEH
jgi:iron complex outermembrane receptor protein